MSDKGKVLLEVKNLQKKFDDVQVLDGISTEIYQGEVVAVIGPSGSGKSTFLRSLNLLEIPTGGQILFEGADITDPKVDINRHRQKIGMVFQQFNLFPHKTVKENIMMAPVTLKLMTPEEASKKSRGAACKSGTSRQGRLISGKPFRRTKTANRYRPGYGYESGCDAV